LWRRLQNALEKQAALTWMGICFPFPSFWSSAPRQELWAAFPWHMGALIPGACTFRKKFICSLESSGKGASTLLASWAALLSFLSHWKRTTPGILVLDKLLPTTP
jgi:hypothetical protein